MKTPTNFDANKSNMIRASLMQHADQINAYHQTAETAAVKAIHAALMAGKLLIEAKVMCKHGDWQNWLGKNCNVSYRTAAKYMRLSKHWNEIQAQGVEMEHFPIDAALTLIAKPKPIAMEPGAKTGRKGAATAYLKGEAEADVSQVEYEHIEKNEADRLEEGEIDCGPAESTVWKSFQLSAIATCEALKRAIGDLNESKSSSQNDALVKQCDSIWEGLRSW